MKFGFRLPEVVKNPGSFYLAFSPSSAFGICIHSSLPYSLSPSTPTHHFDLHHWAGMDATSKGAGKAPFTLCVGGPLLRRKVAWTVGTLGVSAAICVTPWHSTEEPFRGTALLLAMLMGPLGKRVINSRHIGTDTPLLQMLRRWPGTTWGSLHHHYLS